MSLQLNATKLKFWCQKVLPLVYDDSLSYYELLNKVVTYLNNTISDIDTLADSYDELLEYVNATVEELESTISDVLQEMIDDGSMAEIIESSLLEDYAKKNLIANTESSTTASQAYSAGEYFILNDTLYRATTSILSGATITEGTNCESVDVGEVLAELKTNGITDVVDNTVLGYIQKIKNGVTSNIVGVDSTPTNLSQKLVRSSGVFAADKAIKDLISGTESSTTASQAYSAGEYFILNDTLYRATTSISQGATIVSGTNCESIDVGDALSELKSALNALHPTKKYLFIGDSYSVLSPNSWVTYLEDILGLTRNTDSFLIGANSRGFIGDETQSDDMTWLTLVQNNLTGIPTDEITDILVCGGSNDSTYTLAQLASPIQTLITYLLATFPKATVHVGMIAYAWHQPHLPRQTRTYAAYMQAVQYGAVFIKDAYNLWHNKYWIRADGIHPTDAGSLNIAKGLAAYIKTGNVITTTSPALVTNTLTFENTILESGTPVTYIMQTQLIGETIVTLINIDVTFSTAITFSASDAIQIVANIYVGTEQYLIGGTNATMTEASLRIWDGTGWIVIPSKVFVVDSTIKIQAQYTGTTGSTNQNINCERFRLLNVRLECPAIGN